MHPNDWANALDKFWGAQVGSRVVLMIEPTSLVHVAELSGIIFSSVDEAESDFLAAVRTYLNGKKTGPWNPEPYSPGIPPRFLLQIAVQVYAASKMADDPDGSFTSNAYYVQLERLVGEAGAKERFASNDQGVCHQRLWRQRLLEWADEKSLDLTIPVDRTYRDRHVQLPKSQSVLRVGDLARLPIFFKRFGLQPIDLSDPNSTHQQLSDVEPFLRNNRRDSTLFSRSAQSVLNDVQKYPVAVVQVQETFRQWDGRLKISEAGRPQSRRLPRIQLWIDFQRKRNRLRASSGESIETARVLSDNDFRSILEGQVVGEIQIGLRDRLALFHYQEDHGAFQLIDSLEAGERGLLIAGPMGLQHLQRLLDDEALCQSVCSISGEPIDDSEAIDGLPNGCYIAEFKIADPLPDIVTIADQWLPFLRSARAGISLGGGLRIERKENWVSGAGPYIKLSGSNCPSFITVDGLRYTISSRLVQLGRFSNPGEHEVIAIIDGQRCVKQFSVVNPHSAVPLDFPDRSWNFLKGRWPIFQCAKAEEASDTGFVRLAGIRSSGLISHLKAAECCPHSEQQEAIRLLSGMPIFDADRGCSTHPLVKYLLEQRQSSQKRRSVTT